jgi:hypothetical protein
VEEYDFATLAREILTSRGAEVKASPQSAAEIAKEMIVPAVLTTGPR